MTDEPKRPTKPSLIATMTGIAPLPDELRRAPKHRQEAKVKSSALGLVIMAIAGVVLSLACVLVYVTRTAPNLWLLGGVGGFGFMLLSFGALVTDRETVWPVLQGMVKLVGEVRRSGKS